MSEQAYQLALSWAMSRGGAEDWFQLGCSLYGLQRWQAAAAAFARCVERDPLHHRAWCNYGWCKHLGGESEVAKRLLDRSAQLAPNEGTTHALLAQVLLTLGETEGARAVAELSVELAPEVPVNQVGYTLALFGAGEWRKAWEVYEWRFRYRLPEFEHRPYRVWRGERVETLFIECEQGSGDSIMAARWFPACFERANKTIIYCHGPLYGLFDINFTSERVAVYPLPRPLPTADAWTPTMSIPAALGLGTPAVMEPYIHAKIDD